VPKDGDGWIDGWMHGHGRRWKEGGGGVGDPKANTYCPKP